MTEVVLHPGRYLAAELEKRSMSYAVAAELLDLTQSHISFLCNCRRAVTWPVAKKLAEHFERSASFWMEQQEAWEKQQFQPVKEGQ